MLRFVVAAGSFCFGLALTAAAPLAAQKPEAISAPKLKPTLTAPPPGQPTLDPNQPSQTSTQTAGAPAPAPDTTQPNAGPQILTGPSGGITNLGGGAPAGGSTGETSSTQYAAMGTNRSYAAGRFSLLVETKPVGFVKKLEGGTVVGEVGLNVGGAGKKQITRTQPEEITVAVGMGGTPILDWVAQSLRGEYRPKNGSILAADFDYKATSQADFSDAVITEFTVPTLDASGKEAAYFTVKIQPQTVRLQKGDGRDIKDDAGVKQKSWLTSNFRFDMDGLDGSKVATIESFTVRLRGAAEKVGDLREMKATGGMEFPNLKLSISNASLGSWLNWYDDFLVNRNNDDQHEKNGAIVLLRPDMKLELGRINLSNCGLYRLVNAFEANSEKVKRFTVELYCERMDLALSNAAGAP